MKATEQSGSFDFLNNLPGAKKITPKKTKTKKVEQEPKQETQEEYMERMLEKKGTGINLRADGSDPEWNCITNDYFFRGD